MWVELKLWQWHCGVLVSLEPHKFVAWDLCCAVWTDATCLESGLGADVRHFCSCWRLIVCSTAVCVNAGAFVHACLVFTLIWTVGSHFIIIIIIIIIFSYLFYFYFYSFIFPFFVLLAFTFLYILFLHCVCAKSMRVPKVWYVSKSSTFMVPGVR